MPDDIFDEIIHEYLQLIIESIDLINQRFSVIENPDDLVSNENGVLILDAVAMRLQIIGELLKKIDKKDQKLLKSHPDVNWNNIIRLRNIISHHYEKVDHEIIFDICINHIPKLKQTIQSMVNQ